MIGITVIIVIMAAFFVEIIVNYCIVQETIAQYLNSSHSSTIILEFSKLFLGNFLNASFPLKLVLGLK